MPDDGYREIAADLEPLGVPVEMSRLFQVDLIKPAAAVSLAPAVVGEILRGVDLLYRTGPGWLDQRLEDFSSAFRERYEEAREVPLLEVLDEESGIGFERSNQAGAEASPLLSGLSMLPRIDRRSVPWAEREARILRRLSETLRAGETEMALDEADVEALDTIERPPLPDAFHAMVSLAASSSEALAAGDFRLLVDHAAGPSGARILGRFCHADETVRAGVEEHLEAEEALVPDALFAEIVHLPEGRIGNILARPLLRRFEIPFLGRSGAPEEWQIPVHDLLVTVIGDRIRLRSKSLGREVVPRLTNAHNSSLSSLGLYRFLAALQPQGRIGTVAWSWGPFEAAPFLPRVVSGRLVLCRARWLLTASDIRPLAEASGAARWSLAETWRRDRRMPRLVALADGDNELLLDFHNPLSLDAVVEVIKSREEAVLTEVFPGPDELCAEGPEGRFFHELVVPFVRRATEPAQAPVFVPSAAPSVPLESRPVPRIVPPGADWLYAKLYCGTASADRVLRDELAPLGRWAVESGAARSWFFMRYGDPRWHLRVRFQGDPERLHDDLQPRLEEVFARLLDAGTAWKVQLDTYGREVERYGGEAGVELSEEIFFHDSEAVVALLDLCSGDSGADLRWRLALLGMDRLLDDFGLDLEARQAHCERGREGFAARYRYDLLRGPVADRLREERGVLQRLLGSAPEAADEEHRPGLTILDRRTRAIAPIVREAPGSRAPGAARHARGEDRPQLRPHVRQPAEPLRRPRARAGALRLPGPALPVRDRPRPGREEGGKKEGRPRRRASRRRGVKSGCQGRWQLVGRTIAPGPPPRRPRARRRSTARPDTARARRVDSARRCRRAGRRWHRSPLRGQTAGAREPAATSPRGRGSGDSSGENTWSARSGSRRRGPTCWTRRSAWCTSSTGPWTPRCWRKSRP